MELKTVFRYPGGKTKLIKNIVSQIRNIQGNQFDSQDDFTFVDVFVGGGSVAIGISNDFPKAKIVVNDLDKNIYAFWQIMCSKEGLKTLTEDVIQYKKPTIENFKALREMAKKDDLTQPQKAFLALFFNRTTFSGIFQSGPIGGFDQSGEYKIGCRYNAKKMKDTIEKISDRFSKRGVKCFCEDYVSILKKYKDNENALLYLDPPYMKQGKQLYNHYMQPKDYETMADILKDCKAKWIVSHDDYPDFVKLFDGWAKIQTIEGVPYTINSIRDKKRKELLITKE